MEGRGGCGSAVEDPYKQAIPDDVLDLPPGFRFHPTDEEVITHYLTPKVLNPLFAAIAIALVDLNKCEPWDMPGRAKTGEKDWYFFCQKDRKYPTGTRTNRATCAGYWKATGRDKEIYKGSGRNLVGMKKTLVFYTGRAPKGSKTNWVMHEFRLEGLFPYRHINKDEWVVCRVFNKTLGRINSNNHAAPSEGTDSAASFIDKHLKNPSPPPPLVNPSNCVICSNSNCEHNGFVGEDHPDRTGHTLITINQSHGSSEGLSYLPCLPAQNCTSNPNFSDPLGNSDDLLQRQMGSTFSEGFKFQAHPDITEQFLLGYTWFSGEGGTDTVANKETTAAIMSNTGRGGGEGGYYGYLEGSLVDTISDYDGLWDFESLRKS